MKKLGLIGGVGPGIYDSLLSWNYLWCSEKTEQTFFPAISN